MSRRVANLLWKIALDLMQKLHIAYSLLCFTVLLDIILMLAVSFRQSLLISSTSSLA